ncbi:MAG: CocE/NonD family hydrolase [Acidobacteriota bacterium]
MKRIVWLLLFALISASGFSLAAQRSSTASILPASAPFNATTVMIQMRDGKQLAADVYIPKSGGRFPVVLVQTPYNKNQLRAAFTGQGRFGSDSLFTDASYAFVVTDWRGKFASQSALAAGEQADIGRDGFDTCAWIAKQEWSNGRIATWGPSALGRVQYETARNNPPNLVCSVPLVMPLNLDYDIYFPGGVLWEEFLIMLGRIGFGTHLHDLIASRPIKDDGWTKVIAATFVKGGDIRTPMLFIGGWYDIYTDGVIAAFEAVRTGGGEKARAHSKLIVGPWPHQTDQARNGQLEFPNAQYFGMTKARAFLDYWMKQTPNNFDQKEPPITYYQMGANVWRSTAVWPPKESRDVEYFLHADRSLSTATPKENKASLVFKYDPASPVPTIGGHVLDQALQPGPQDQREKVESRSDVLIFSTPALEKDLAVAGKVKVKLFVSSDCVDTDFTAILTDVYPDGRSMLVSEGIRRMRFRNTTSKEEMMQPGEIYSVTIELPSTAITFLKGHRARVIISSSSYPKFAINLNDGGPMYKKGKGLIATNNIHLDKQHRSALVLPIGK